VDYEDAYIDSKKMRGRKTMKTEKEKDRWVG
jgi:hypothetical protein